MQRYERMTQTFKEIRKLRSRKPFVRNTWPLFVS